LASNAAIPEIRRIEFRIGTNVGDIIIDEGDLYGDGVNIAGRHLVIWECVSFWPVTAAPTGLIVQAPQCTEFFIAAELRFLHGRFEHLDRLVVDLDRHRKWMSVLSAMRD
jgi:hypothetical protein